MDKYATFLIENLRKTSECDVMSDKHIRQTLTVALFNLCYAFYIAFVERIKCYIMPHKIVQVGLPVDGVCIHFPKTRFVWAIGCETWTECSGSQLVTASSGLCGRHFEKVCSLFLRLWHDQLVMTWMEKLNRKRACMSDNRIILGTKYWPFTSSYLREQNKISLIH